MGQQPKVVTLLFEQARFGVAGGKLRLHARALRITDTGASLLAYSLGGSLTNHQAASRNEGRSKIKGKLPVRIDVAMEQRSQDPKILDAEALPQAFSLNRSLDQNRVDKHQTVLQQLQRQR